MNSYTQCALCDKDSVVVLGDNDKTVGFCQKHADSFSGFWKPTPTLYQRVKYWLRLHIWNWA